MDSVVKHDPADARLDQVRLARADGPPPHPGAARTHRGPPQGRRGPPRRRAQAPDLLCQSNVDAHHSLRSALALLLVPALLGAQAPITLDGARPSRLKDAVALAQQNALGAVQARGQVRTAESSVRAARAALFPSLNFTMGQVNQSGDRFDSQGRLVPYLAPQPWSYSTGISSTLNLFDGGRRLERDPPHALRRRRGRSERGLAAVQRLAAGQDAVLQHPRRARVRGGGARAARAGARSS